MRKLKKRFLIIFSVITVSVVCFAFARGYLRDFFGLEIPTYEQMEKIVTDNIEYFEKNVLGLVDFYNNIQVVTNKYGSGFGRDDWAYYDIGDNLTVISESESSLSEEELAVIQKSECKKILKDLRFQKIAVFDNCVYYIKTSNLAYSYGILYCTQEETMQYMQSEDTQLAGTHITDAKEIQENWYYVKTE